MMANELVSIIVPSYNQGRYIRTTLESIFSQDYPHLEIIVMDGGSTDNTCDILRSIDDPRMTWRSEPDNGQSHAINKGLRQSNGSILGYLNSDDLLLPGAIHKILDYFDTQPECDLVYGHNYMIDENGRVVQETPVSNFHITDMLHPIGGLPQPGLFWQRRVTDHIGLFDETLHYTMDYDYWLRAALAGFRLDYLRTSLGAFRLHSTSKTVSQSSRFWDDWGKVLDKVYSRPDLCPDIRQTETEARNYVKWQRTKALWGDGKYEETRPVLRSFLLHRNRWQRRLLAATMLLDSYLSTSITRGLWWLYRRFTASDLYVL